MSKLRIDTVIFDMDDVLCAYDRKVRIDHLAETTGLPPAQIVEAIWTSGFDDRADEGAYTADEYLTETNRRLGTPLTADQWAAARRASMTPYPEVLEVVRILSAQVTVAGFTNNGPLMQRMMSEIFPEAVAIFGQRLFFSSDIGLAKPNSDAFHAVLGRLGAEPSSTLFIDDNERYIEGARTAGLHVHRFTEFEKLKSALIEFGLI